MPNLLQRLTHHLRRRFFPSLTPTPTPIPTPLEPTPDRLCLDCDSPDIWAESRCQRCCENYLGYLFEVQEETRLWAHDEERDAREKSYYAAVFDEARQRSLTCMERHRELGQIQLERKRLDVLERAHHQGIQDLIDTFQSNPPVAAEL